MKTWVAFLKSINVGGNNILPMKEFRSIGNALGYHKFTTYIQSGNCVFNSIQSDGKIIASEIVDSISKNFGFCPPIIVMSVDTLKKAIDLNPYKVEADKANTVHFHFLWSENSELDGVKARRLAIPSEEYELIGKVLYMHAPEGVGRSKLFTKIPKLLGDDVTVRNLRTATKVFDIAMDQKV